MDPRLPYFSPFRTKMVLSCLFAFVSLVSVTIKSVAEQPSIRVELPPQQSYQLDCITTTDCVLKPDLAPPKPKKIDYTRAIVIEHIQEPQANYLITKHISSSINPLLAKALLVFPKTTKIFDTKVNFIAVNNRDEIPLQDQDEAKKGAAGDVRILKGVVDISTKDLHGYEKLEGWLEANKDTWRYINLKRYPDSRTLTLRKYSDTKMQHYEYTTTKKIYIIGKINTYKVPQQYGHSQANHQIFDFFPYRSHSFADRSKFFEEFLRRKRENSSFPDTGALKPSYPFATREKRTDALGRPLTHKKRPYHLRSYYEQFKMMQQRRTPRRLGR